jgi:hypothetical protein
MNLLNNIFHSSLKIINFEDMQQIIKNPAQHILINVLLPEEQDCLILGTLPIYSEEKTINELVQAYETTSKVIVLYGKNSGDYSLLEKKNKQLTSLGFFTVYVYLGGLFEWVLLQDIYGSDNFPTTKRILDILRFRSPKLMG